MGQYRATVAYHSRITILRAFKAGEAITASTAHSRLGDRSMSAVKGACTRLVEAGQLQIVGKEWSKFGPAHLYALPGTKLMDAPSQGERKMVQRSALIDILTPPVPAAWLTSKPSRKHTLRDDEVAA